MKQIAIVVAVVFGIMLLAGSPV